MTATACESASPETLPFPAEELEGSIVQRLRRVAAQCGARIAISEKQDQLSYEGLEQRSEGLAAFLLDAMGRGQEPVALMFKQGADAVVAQLGVLKAGKLYAHVDPELPEQRQLLLLRNLGTGTVLCDSACEEGALLLAGKVEGLRVINSAAVRGSESSVEVSIQPDDPALIVFTSGSTGAPQGVLLSHRNVLMIARSHGRDFGLAPRDRASQICPLWSAASASEVFSALLNGTRLYPFSIKEGGVFAFLQLLEEEAVTTFTSTPILFRLLFSAAAEGQRFPAMRLIRLGGDKTTSRDVQLFKRCFEAHCLLRLGYGSSEYLLVTQFLIASHFDLDAEVAPAGFSMPGCELSVLDESQQVVRQGEVGEIAVTSAYLGLGYWRNAELTRQRFLCSGRGSGERTYLTRDLGYLDERGCLHLVGRADSRVKIYGKMVLLNDVEAALMAIQGVRDAAVLPRDSAERGTELVAFVVAAKGLGATVLRQRLRETLSAELIPRKFEFLDALPLRSNSKVDRLRLKELAGSEGRAS